MGCSDFHCTRLAHSSPECTSTTSSFNNHHYTMRCCSASAGHYAMAAGDATAAAAKFLAVAQSSPSPQQACLAAVDAALALLATGQAEDVSKAADVLRHHQLFESLDTSLPYGERYAGEAHLTRVCCTAMHMSASMITWSSAVSRFCWGDCGCGDADWWGVVKHTFTTGCCWQRVLHCL